MNINKSSFIENPVKLDISRSAFDLSYDWFGTVNAGMVFPMYLQEVLPSSSFKYKESCVIRSTTPVCPALQDLFMDVFYFYVPNKLLLSRESMSPAVDNGNHSWKAIIGAQDSKLNVPYPASGLHVPYIKISNGDHSGKLADYFGLPVLPTANEINVSCLPFLAYFSVWNDYFRDSNSVDPVTYSVYTNNCVITIPYSGLTNVNYAHQIPILPACRMHGYFGSALPFPQRNAAAVTLPLGVTAPLTLTVTPPGGDKTVYDPGLFEFAGTAAYGSSNDVALELNESGTTINGIVEADLSRATAASIDKLRVAFATQRWYEALARSGNGNYGDLIYGMYGVRQHDCSSGRAEYLGGKRIPLFQTQVSQTSATTTNAGGDLQPLGSTGAFSLSGDSNSYIFTKSLDDFGYIIGLGVIRCKDTFHQGIERHWSRFSAFDFYWKQFANIGEQPILEKEIYASGVKANDDSVFGYQEAWAEYRFRQSVTTGELRPNKSMRAWTYTNNFTSAPTLKGFLDAEKLKNNVDQNLLVNASTAGFQFEITFHHDVVGVLPMPTYSVPGLIDHH